MQKEIEEHFETIIAGIQATQVIEAMDLNGIYAIYNKLSKSDLKRDSWVSYC